MTDQIKFTLDGKEVSASADETVWQVAKREGTRIPHLCYLDKPGYRADGNCRACMVEIEGERVLAASCQRKVAEGMVVKTDTERADKSRKMVFEMLAADMRSVDDQSSFAEWASSMGIGAGERLPSKFDGHADHASAGTPGVHDITNPAIAVNLDACIACNLCVRACREVQVNDVLGMGERGHDKHIIHLHFATGAYTQITGDTGIQIDRNRRIGDVVHAGCACAGMIRMTIKL